MENTSWTSALIPTGIRTTPNNTLNGLVHVEHTSWAVALIQTYIFITQPQYTNNLTTQEPRSTVWSS